MIEMLTHPLIIPVEAVPKANINIHYRLKNVPSHKIKNESNRKAKERWDRALNTSDFMRYTLESERNRRGFFHEVKRSDKVWLAVIYYFEYQKSINEAMLIKDTDNCDKLTRDVMAKAGYMPNDCQISFQMTGKQVVKESPKIEILSFTVSDSWQHFMDWSKNTAELCARRIYEHQISIIP